MAFLVLSISAFSSFSHFLAFLSSSFTANFRLNMCFSIAEADISFPVLTRGNHALHNKKSALSTEKHCGPEDNY
uniref:Putative secreted protein n=1 Tax=Anopheles darlingi TaxID=43151 RepID=A0A2M4D3H7_ANODA